MARIWAVSTRIIRQAQSARIGPDTEDGTQSLGKGCRAWELEDLLFQEENRCRVEGDNDNRWNEPMVERNEGNTSQSKDKNDAKDVQKRQDKPSGIELSLYSEVE